MIYGGSWISLAILVSFWKVYDVESAFRQLYAFQKGNDMERVLSSLHQVWLLALLCYATWSVPLLSAITVAFMLENYVTCTLINLSVMSRLEECLPVLRKFGSWCPFVIQVAMRCGFVIMYIFSFKFQPCLVMACVGFDRFYSSLPKGIRKQIYALDVPLQLDGKAVVLWISAILCSLWQFLHGYKFSLLCLFVPFGFLIIESKMEGN